MQKDNRSHLRLPVESTVFIEVISSGADGKTRGKLSGAQTRNVSRTGCMSVWNTNSPWAPSCKSAWDCLPQDTPLPRGRGQVVPANRRRPAVGQLVSPCSSGRFRYRHMGRVADRNGTLSPPAD